MTAAPGIYDIAVIGGGVNGCGIARDAAGRGYSTFLAEMDDLASGTSSAATKLVHGGLRYLEHFEFRLVRESLAERERLWAMAPHIVWPLRFVLPYEKGQRPKWMLRSGLFLYDHMGGRRKLPPTKSLDLRADAAGKPLKSHFTSGYEYSDCWVDDSRLVALNARDAADRGAEIRTRAKVVGARREDGAWRVTVEAAGTGRREEIGARLLVNAAGPWVGRVLETLGGGGGGHRVRLVQGSHAVVKRLFEHDRCYIFQNADGRIVFAIPFETDFTLLGTTDREFSGDPSAAEVSEEEIAYLLAAAGEYFATPIRREDLVWTYTGVRPLHEDGAAKAQEATRDYVLTLHRGGPPLLNVFGGKLTTYRRLAEEAMERIGEAIGSKGAPWTGESHLPGGDFGVREAPNLVAGLSRDFPFLAKPTLRRLVRQYGTVARKILEGAKGAEDMGVHLGADLYAREVDHLVANEWARSAEDILWRRTKLGLRLFPEETARLEDYLAAHGRT